MRPLLFLIIPLLLLSACIEEVELEEPTFIKLIGREGTSIAEKVMELPNGDIMVIGELGVAAHNIESGPIGSEVGVLEDQAPFIAITDTNGNIKQMRSYPVGNFSDEYATLFDSENKTTFHDAIPTADGGYLVLARLTGLNVVFAPPLDTTFISTNTLSGATPFMFKLDADLNIVSFINFNGGKNWDFIVRSRPRMKRLPNGNIGLLFGFAVENFTQFSGYTFMEINEGLDTLRFYNQFERFGFPFKIGYDFNITDAENVIVVGQLGNTLGVLFFPLDGSANEQGGIFDDSGVLSGLNANEHFIEIDDNGSVSVVYTNPPGEIRFFQLNQNQEFFNEQVTLVSGIHAPRAFYRCINGDYLLYAINIPDDSSDTFGTLYRLTPRGEVLWSKELAGVPGDVTEASDGSLLVVTNKIYNGLLTKINLIKMTANGEVF